MSSVASCSDSGFFCYIHERRLAPTEQIGASSERHKLPGAAIGGYLRVPRFFYARPRLRRVRAAFLAARERSAALRDLAAERV